MRGEGAGNYDRRYFRERVTTEDIRQPHSLPLQILAELGLVGGLLLALCGMGVVLGAWRTARAARTSREARVLAVGSVGVLAAWLSQTSVDWMHLLPGLTGTALVAACALEVSSAPAAAPATTRRRRPGLLPVLALAVVLLVAGISLSRQGLTERYRMRAQDALAQDPATALREADRAVRLDSMALGGYYVKAAALARFGEAPAARRVLLDATEKEPGRFLTWVLLGDLAVRTDDVGAARRYYGRALELNPRNTGLQRLAADPLEARG